MKLSRLVQCVTPLILLAGVELSADPARRANEPPGGSRKASEPFRPEAEKVLLPWDESPETAGGRPVALATGDFDEDGSLDLAIGMMNSQGNSVAVYSRLPGGPIPVGAAGDAMEIEPRHLFSLLVVFPVTVPPRMLRCGDFDGDGHTDFLVATSGEERIVMAKGDGRGRFGPPHLRVLPGALRSLAAKDWDRDGLDDVRFEVACQGEILTYRATAPDGAWRAIAEKVSARQDLGADSETGSEDGLSAPPQGFDGVVRLRLNADAFDDAIAFREDSRTVAVFLTRAESVFTVTTSADGGPGSLRQALLNANASPGADAVAFSIGTGPVTLAPLTPLPIIAEALTLDATTQPGYSGWPLIELSGALAGIGAVGLDVAGGDTVVRGVVLNRFEHGGLQISGTGRNIVEGNFVGTDPTGTSGFVNPWTAPDGLSVGVSIADSPDNRIGGTAASSRNVISANWDVGVSITGTASTGNMVLGNYIGTDATGTTALGNGARGVDLRDGSSNFIGGTAAGAGNVISGNGTVPPGADGLQIRSANGNIVQGNLIGVDAIGQVAVPNTGGGIRLRDASTNRIGGTVPAARNIVSANLVDGIEVRGASTANLIQGNIIGAAADGTTPRPNGLSGILLTSGSGNSIGGVAGAGNRIAFNTTEGVLAVAGTGNAISGNSIASNGGLGIDLGAPGVNPNDAGDGDAGPNNLQNFPVLATSSCGGVTTIQGTLDSSPDTAFTLEFFASDFCDVLGNGEGGHFLGSAPIATDPSGNASFTVHLGGTAPPGHFITATATAAGDTSEFSACRVVTGSVIGEVTGLEWTSAGATGLQWTPNAGALSYSLHRGDPSTLPLLADARADSCLRWTGAAASTGEILSETPAPGSFYWYLVTASTTCGEGTPGAGLTLNGTGTCP